MRRAPMLLAYVPNTRQLNPSQSGLTHLYIAYFWKQNKTNIKKINSSFSFLLMEPVLHWEGLESQWNNQVSNRARPAAGSFFLQQPRRIHQAADRPRLASWCEYIWTDRNDWNWLLATNSWQVLHEPSMGKRCMLVCICMCVYTKIAAVE